jgi:hypothetical protein
MTDRGLAIVLFVSVVLVILSLATVFNPTFNPNLKPAPYCNNQSNLSTTGYELHASCGIPADNQSDNMSDHESNGIAVAAVYQNAAFATGW